MIINLRINTDLNVITPSSQDATFAELAEYLLFNMPGDLGAYYGKLLSFSNPEKKAALIESIPSRFTAAALVAFQKAEEEKEAEK